MLHHGSSTNGARMNEEEEEEGWGAFDPDANLIEEEEEDAAGDDRHVFREGGRMSSVSDVELVRGAEDSIASDRLSTLRRASVAGSDILSPAPGDVKRGSGDPMDDDDFPLNDDGDGTISGLNLDDDGSGLGRTRDGRDSSLRLSLDTTQDGGARRSVGIGGLELDGAKGERKRGATAGPRTRRKRRKIVIDNEATELSSERIKDMLANTSDIVRQDIRHPADWIEPPSSQDSDEIAPLGGFMKLRRKSRGIILENLPYDRLLARPNLGDDGCLAPELVELWQRNAARVLGKSHLPFRMRGKAGEQQRRERAAKIMEEAAEEEARRKKAEQEGEKEADEVEVGRFAEGGADASGSGSGADQSEFPLPDDEEGFPPMDDEEDMHPPTGLDDEIIGDRGMDETGGFAEDMALMQADDRSVASDFSLGAVNDLDSANDDNEDERQAAGGEETSSQAKWHKHTVKVLTMLKRNMANPDEIMDAEGDNEGPKKKPTQLSYDKLSNGCSRRTAAGVFFELLQLKTWDFIELEQDESYGDIVVTAGSRFKECPPPG
jgi:cohesin complex subunit SCC1